MEKKMETTIGVKDLGFILGLIVGEWKRKWKLP